MSDQRLFQRNLLVIGSVHALALIIFLVAGKVWTEPVPVQVTWLGGSLGEGGATARESETQADEEEPAPERVAKLPAPDPPPAKTPPPSELVDPEDVRPPETPKPATPKPITPKPKSEATPKPKPKSSPTPKPQAKTSPKPKGTASPKPVTSVASRKPVETDSGAAKTGNVAKESDQRGAAGSGNGSGKTGSGSGDPSEFNWYKDMIRDRFYSRWAQPVGLGQNMVATLKLRINNDGTISNREMLRSSGNPQMDESVLRAAQKLEQIDPLPKGLGNGEFYDVSVDFKVGG